MPVIAAQAAPLQLIIQSDIAASALRAAVTACEFIQRKRHHNPLTRSMSLWHRQCRRIAGTPPGVHHCHLRADQHATHCWNSKAGHLPIEQVAPAQRGRSGDVAMYTSGRGRVSHPAAPDLRRDCLMTRWLWWWHRQRCSSAGAVPGVVTLHLPGAQLEGQVRRVLWVRKCQSLCCCCGQAPLQAQCACSSALTTCAPNTLLNHKEHCAA